MWIVNLMKLKCHRRVQFSSLEVVVVKKSTKFEYEATVYLNKFGTLGQQLDDIPSLEEILAILTLSIIVHINIIILVYIY